MRGPDDGSKIVRVFNAVEDDVHAFACDGFFESGVTLRGAKADHALMRDSGCGSIEHFARLIADGDAVFAGEIDDFLNARPGGTFGDEDAIEGAPGPQSFTDGMDSWQRGHYDKVTLS